MSEEQKYESPKTHKSYDFTDEEVRVILELSGLNRAHWKRQVHHDPIGKSQQESRMKILNSIILELGANPEKYD